MPASFGGDLDQGEFEIAALKRQVAALAASAASEGIKDERPDSLDGSSNRRKGHKKAGVFDYWQATATSNNNVPATPPSSSMVTPTPQKRPSQASSSSSAQQNQHQHKHHFSPTFAPPLGRPPSSPPKLLASPTKSKPTFDFDAATADNNPSATAMMSSSSTRGETWSPASEIQTGGVAKFKHMFATPTDNNNNPNNTIKPTYSRDDIDSQTSGGVAKFKNMFDPMQVGNNSSAKHINPRDDIDSNRIGGIKAMWGKKAGESISGGIPALPMGKPPPHTGRIDRSRFEASGNGSVASSSANSGSGSSGRATMPIHPAPGKLVDAPSSAMRRTTVTAASTCYEDSSGDENNNVSSSVANNNDGAGGGGGESIQLHADSDRQMMVSEEVTSYNDHSFADDHDEEGSVELSYGEDDNIVADAQSQGGGGNDNGPPPSDDHDDDDDSSDTEFSEDEMIKAEIILLVNEVLPDQMDNVDEMLLQFEGREKKLRDTLRGMQERSSMAASASVAPSSDSRTSEGGDDDYGDGDGQRVGATTAAAASATTTEGGHEAQQGDVTPDGEVEMMRNLADTPNNVVYDDESLTTMSSIPHEDPTTLQQPVGDAYLAVAADVAEMASMVDVSSTTSTPPVQNSADLGPRTPTTSNANRARDRVTMPAAVASLSSPGQSTKSSSHDEVESIHPVVLGDGRSLADGTIESNESRHVSFAHAGTGLPLDHLEPEDPKEKATDGFTGRNYYYNDPVASSGPSKGRSGMSETEKQTSSSSDDTSHASGHNQLSGETTPTPDIEEGIPAAKEKSKLPLVGPAASSPNTEITAKPESQGDFSEYSIGVPSQIGLLKRNGGDGIGGTATVVSEIPDPPPRAVWYKQRRTKVCACLAFLLLAACGAVLGLFFSGMFDQWFGKTNANSSGGEGVDKAVSQPTSSVLEATFVPTYYSSVKPSAAPSNYPITACIESLSTEYKTLGVGNSPKNFPPNIAMDGNNAIVVTNSGDIRFYTLAKYLNGRERQGQGQEQRWDEVDFFPNANRGQFTPSVSISGNIAVVGFLYTVLGFNQGSGGAYVYERDDDNGRWKFVDVLTPNDDDDGNRIEGDAKFGWSVAVDAKQKTNPLIAIGAYGEAEGRGSVFVFEQQTLNNDRKVRKQQHSWSQVGKILPKFCANGSFGYSVAVFNNLIAASSDCESIVQINEWDHKYKSIESVQNIRYISFDLGAIGSLVMNKDTLVYSTVFGAVVIFEKEKSDRPYEFYKQLDFSGNENLPDYPIALGQDLLVVGIGNKYGVYSKRGADWQGGFYIENVEAFEDGVPSVAVGGRTVLAGSGSPNHEVYHYNIELCTDPIPTQSPATMEQILVTSLSPSLGPSNKPTLPPSDAPTSSSPSFSPNKKPTPSPSASPTEQPISTSSPTFRPSKKPTLSPSDSPESSSPSSSPTKKPTPLPSAPPTEQPISTSSPSFGPTKKPSQQPTGSPNQQPTISPTDKEEQAPLLPVGKEDPSSPQPSCYPVEIVILFDSSPFGSGYVLNKLGSGGQTNIDTFFPYDSTLANQEYTKPFCLEEGSYKFSMYDSYGDGLCCGNGNGEYAVTMSDGTIILVQGAEFGYSEDTVFQLPPSLLS